VGFEIKNEMVDQISEFAFYADMSANANLKRRIIETKKEYRSDFTKRFTGFMNGPLSSGLSAETICVPHKKKKKSGCDTTIIITSKGLSKVAIYKNKYPNFGDQLDDWDKLKRETGKSLFTSQLKRQKKYRDKYAVFQKFISNQLKVEHQHMSKETASCVWHSDVVIFNQHYRKNPESIWNTENLLDMFHITQSTDIGSILKSVCLGGDAEPVHIPNGIEDYIRTNKLPSRVISIKVLD